MSSGEEALATWLRSRARETDRVVALEEALLGGKFVRYAFRRLGAFIVARGGATVLHVIELTWLFEIFSAKPFVASLAFQNGGLVVDAFLWGALEGLRRRSRELGPSSEAAALTTRWLGVALRVGAVALLVPIAYAAWAWWDTGKPPTMLNVYALVCAFRLAADAVVRTYYSGVFAYRRVARPAWAVVLSPVSVALGTVVLWPSLAGWAFPAALFGSVVLTRTVVFVFTRRAYRRYRIPQPSFRIALRPPRLAREIFGHAALAGVANLTSRLGALVLLAAVVPSLTRLDDGGMDDGGTVEPFALALHLASPLLFIASQWAFVFYHDYKRLEGGESVLLARALDRRLFATAIVVGIGAWLSSSALVLFYVPWGEVWPTLLALLPAALGLSFWTAAQLHGFARGEFVRQVVSAAIMLAVLAAVLAGTWTGSVVWYVALGAAPWTAVLADAWLARSRRAHAVGLTADLAAWTRALAASKAPTIAWEADLTKRAGAIADAIASRLGARGAIARVGSRLVWFERSPWTSRSEWLRLGQGMIRRLDGTAPGRGADVLLSLESRNRVKRPRSGALAELCDAYERLFPEGFVVGVRRAAPRRYLDLAPAVRQEIWRDGVRRHAGGRTRSAHAVWIYAPDGPVEAIFAAPKPIDPAKAEIWARQIRESAWQLPATEDIRPIG